MDKLARRIGRPAQWLGVLLLLGSSFAQSAGAAMVVEAECTTAPALGGGLSLCDSTTLATTTTLLVAAFTAPEAGTVTVELTDLEFTTALAVLSFQVSTATGTVLGLSENGSALQFAAVAGTRYFTQVFLMPAAGQSGLANLQATLAPVPLPASVLSLACGFGLLAPLLWGRRRRLEASSDGHNQLI